MVWLLRETDTQIVSSKDGQEKNAAAEVQNVKQDGKEHAMQVFRLATGSAPLLRVPCPEMQCRFC